MKICKIKDNNGKTYLENFKIWKDEIDTSKIILLLIGIITNFFYRLFSIIIIKNLTAIHIIFSNLLYSTLLSWIGTFIQNNNNNKFLIDLFNFIIQLVISFGLFIYLEMIEIMKKMI